MLLMSERRETRDELPSNTYRGNGRALKSYRQRARLTLKGLEEKSGVSYTQISRIENETSKSPRWDTLERLADALGRHVDDLVVYEDVEYWLTEENIEKLDAKKHDWEKREQRKRLNGGSPDTGDRTL